ncbi:MAG TPA: methyltransferase domain-containing protein [Ktedonobacteraceae bacterium]|nr:methyltransferase domain-containing protein [Ktedonobacteraceae bacterium]
MTTSPDSSENKSGYVVDAEDAAEMARLLDQDILVSKSMGGLFPEHVDELEGISDILDIACGPGGWVLSVAREYPHIQVTGIDISERMVAYAQAHAQARGLSNAHFRRMDILKSLDFPSGSFDLVNARTLVGLMSPQTWPLLVSEIVRVCRPGGIVRLTEFEMPMTNSPHFETISWMVLQAMHKAGRSYSPDGRYFTLTAMLGSLLQEAGCQDIQEKPYVINFSSGTEAHEGYTQDMILGFKLITTFLTQLGITTEEKYELAYQQMVAEMLSDRFRALGYGLTVWGICP